MALGFLVSHHKEAKDDCNPIAVVRNNGAVCCRVLPAENGVEDTPSATAVESWITELRKC
jgi:hypothetical protein